MAVQLEHEKLIRALKSAGLVIPDDPNLKEKVSAELSKRGVSPNLTFIANSHYVLVVPDDDDLKKEGR